MATDQILLKKFHAMPDNIKVQVLDFMEYLLEKNVQSTQMTTARKKNNIRKAGTMKGLVLYMAPDFDAPLEDFKDYM